MMRYSPYTEMEKAFMAYLMDTCELTEKTAQTYCSLVRAGVRAGKHGSKTANRYYTDFTKVYWMQMVAAAPVIPLNPVVEVAATTEFTAIAESVDLVVKHYGKLQKVLESNLDPSVKDEVVQQMKAQLAGTAYSLIALLEN